jgi:phenylalanyl-tRNA synthetase alpha chain
MKNRLEQIQKDTLAALSAAKTPADLQEIQNKFFGKKGELTLASKELGKAAPEDRPALGQLINTVKKSLEAEFESKQAEVKQETIKAQLEEEWVDITAPGHKHKTGHIHPLSQVQREVEAIFSSMGFEIKDGPEVESEYFNFEGLNIPESHPARDMQDTFFLDKAPDKDFGHLVLRTHTSPVQIRTMQKEGAPLRMIVPGRVFRYEATDASHDTTFNQVEGLLIDKKISLTHLKGIMQEFLTRLFQKEVTVRFRPGYFPFVEPGLELDFGCLICDCKGCKACKNTGWIEFMGAGMVHPNVLRAGGIDPEEYQGWAFGFGLTRLVMMRYKIPDIRLLTGGDTRFLNQF